MDLPDKKYQIIYADPPWSFGKSGVYQDGGRKDRHVNDQYDTIDKKNLFDIPVSDIVDDNAALFLQVVDSHLKDGIDLMESWGFTYRTIVFIWKKITKNGKTCANVGRWTMKNCEICLLGVKGNMLQYKKVRNIFQLVEVERTKHSKKPEEVRKRIEKLFDTFCQVNP